MEYTESIRKRIGEAPLGTLFVMTDFADIVPNNTGNRAIRRLIAEGELSEVMRGIYLKPKTNEFLGEEEHPSPEEVAKAIGRKNRWIVRPTGELALNLLGLSTQVPADWTFLTDGPYKAYPYGAGHIVLKHTANRLLSALSWDSALLVQALRALGREHVDDAVRMRMAARYTADQLEALDRDTLHAPDWIRAEIHRMKEFPHD